MNSRRPLRSGRSLHVILGAAVALGTVGLALLLLAQREPRGGGVASSAASTQASDPASDATRSHPRAPSSLPKASETPAQTAEQRAPVSYAGEPATKTRVTVRTLSGSGRGDPKPVPGVPVALGTGAPLDPATPELAHAVTDAEGRATIEVPALALSAVATESTWLWVRVDGEGWQRRTTRVALPAPGGEEEVMLFVGQGGSVVGRLLSEAGVPLAGSVQLLRRVPGGPFRQPARSKVGADGWFELNLEEPGRMDLRAVADTRTTDPLDLLANVGVDSAVTTVATAVLRDLDVRFTDPPLSVELRARGPGILRGRVRDAAGQPLAELHVEAWAAALDPVNENSSSVLDTPDALELSLEGGGTVMGNAKTAGDGTFEILGLRADSFRVYAVVTGPHHNLRRHRLTPVPVASTGTPLELVLERPHLVVQLADAAGLPWTGSATVAPPYRHWSTEWTDAPEIVVVPVSERLDGNEEFGHGRYFLHGTPLGVACFEFELPEGRSYLVGLRRRGQAWRPIEVAVPYGASRLERTLVVADDSAMGTLVVSTSPSSAASDSVVVRIEDPASGTQIDRISTRLGESKRLQLELPVGEWRVVVEGSAFRGVFHGEVLGPRSAGAFETQIFVRSDIETHVEARLGSGARLRIRTARSGREGMHTGIPGAAPSEPGEEPELVFFSLHRPDRWPLPVEFLERESSAQYGPDLVRWLPMGEEQTSERLAAGRFTLHATLAGAGTVDTAVELVDGETTDVVVRFP